MNLFKKILNEFIEVSDFTEATPPLEYKQLCTISLNRARYLEAYIKTLDASLLSLPPKSNKKQKIVLAIQLSQKRLSEAIFEKNYFYKLIKKENGHL
jgi:hypothetical protein